MNRWPYRFPGNRNALTLNAKLQARKCVEEAYEVLDAAEAEESDSRIAEEAWDCIQACEGVLRKLPLPTVIVALATVKIKCTGRGDYRRRQK